MADIYTANIILFKNTPLNDFQNTIHFKSNIERDDYFLKDNHFLKEEFDSPFNFVRDRLQLNAPIPYAKCDGVNYCTFISERDNKRYYAYVISYQYINEKVTRLSLLIDVLMTFTQGKTLSTLENIHVVREHLTRTEYNEYLPQLRTNGDILKTTTKRYVKTELDRFTDYFVLFQCSADLSKKFGNEDEPKLETSSGIQYDKLVSPVNLYLISYQYFNGLMEVLAPYPWITQNINSVMLIPSQFIDSEDIIDVETEEFSFHLQTLKDGGISLNKELNGINYSISDLCKIYGINPNEEKHLLRNEYTTAEVYSWDGQRLLIDNAFLDDETGIKFRAVTSIGYFNQIAIYPINYKTSSEEKAVTNSKDEILVDKGTFLNDSIIYNDFTELPILVDNYKLGLANNANRRQLAEDKLITNRASNLLDNSANLNDRFFNATSLLSDLSPTSVLSKFTNEYEFYRTQKAEFADMALQAPTITSQSNGNSFQISNDINGITIKLAAPTEKEMNRIRKYYKMFGYEIEEDGKRVSDIESMTVCNYLQIKGNYRLFGVDVALMEQLRVLLENGVRFWHNDNTDNPMLQNIEENKMR